MQRGKLGVDENSTYGRFPGRTIVANNCKSRLLTCSDPGPDGGYVENSACCRMNINGSQDAWRAMWRSVAALAGDRD